MSPTRILLFAFVAVLSLPAYAGSVSAEVVVDGKAFKPTEVVAFRDREGRNPRKFLTRVVLTASPLNADRIKNSLIPDEILREDSAAQGDHLDVWVFPDGVLEVGVHVNGDDYSSEAFPPDSKEARELIATCTVNTATHVACKIKSKGAVKTRGGRTCTLEVAFDADLLARPAGRPLAQDGGEPGMAFLALYRAADGDDLGKILALLLPARAAQDYRAPYALALRMDHEFHPGDNLRRLKETLSENFVLPKRAKITGGERLTEDHALLDVEGSKESERHPSLYLIEMRRLDGTWRYVKASLVGTLWDEQ